jgi:hypothetical protein
MSNDLLKPRYKVIADYPGNEWKVGDILDRDWGWDGDDEEGFKHHVSDYPHLFKKLEWYEERKLDEMPGHLGCLSPVFKWSKGEIIKVDKWIECFGPTLRFYSPDTDKITHHPFSFTPVTAAEYEAYLQTLTVK